uniref:Cytochrome b n=2 Tax=Macridiscus TaxID=900989 RepID=A0A6C0RU24_9BIVA|nr:cytochrome b [Macridiscus semicancellata]QIA44518.1 cytochrome b [Macridiscus semicancellata]QUA05895.1 cytochrome b [Macridiscus semicancellata]
MVVSTNSSSSPKTFVNWKNNGLTSLLGPAVYNLPVPLNLSSMWNFGSLLIVCLMTQIMSGLLMAVHYTPEVDQAFRSVVHIMRDVNGGWFLRSFHANGASVFFLLAYLHIGRGVYYHSFHMRGTWLVGCLIFVLLMATAFTGYVLPWGQMSFWGATVITNLFGAIPYVGNMVMEWIWGGHCVGDASLKRFFVLHFLSPFIIGVLVAVHIIFLHGTGSSNPIGVDTDGDLVPFHSYYFLKDLVGIVLMGGFLVLLCLLKPDLFLDPTNFIPANPMKTPVHIQPEWYFLFAYSILRSVPSKLGGIGALAASVIILFFLPLYPKSIFRGVSMNVLSQVLFFLFVGDFILLTYIGMCPVEEPFITMGAFASVLYFIFFIAYPMSWFVYEECMLSDWKKLLWSKSAITSSDCLMVK